MPLKSLQHLAAKTNFDALPANWNTFDLERFSREKHLWDYQTQALRHALGVLWKYYDEYCDFVPGENEVANSNRRERLVEWYQNSMFLTKKERETLNVSLKKAKLPLRELVAEFYPLNEETPVLDFKAICNRMSFWMATGSGKTIVLVKLLELLHMLIRRHEIPDNDVLFLTHREDLIEQFQRAVWEYNHSPESPVHIELRELREYPEAKRESPGGLLGRDSTLRVFFYRSDNLSDTHKERIVDFHNYDNDGRWYVLLDEAHKGGQEDSKRKFIYTIMCRAGFLFNFSATFTETLDLATTVHNFNLAEFITKGYGKHIAILRQELTAFKSKKGKQSTSDYSDDEKRKIVAKSMLLLAYTAKKVEELRREVKRSDINGSKPPDFYHHPMLLALVNSVNTEDADLKLYFEQILAIGRGDCPPTMWQQAKAELWEELKEEPEFLYEDRRKLQIHKVELDALTVQDVWRTVYNCESEGSVIEVLVRPGNKQEIAFKMKTSAKPFALIKIGDVTGWLREKLTGFEYVETLETSSFFNDLNAPDSTINILMGSRSFHEGWDSNRPNVINFVNIGVGEDAKKFILQAVGRGVRVQSWRGARRRFEELSESFENKELFRNLKPISIHPETLYVLGTNREALRVVLEELKKEKPDQQYFLRIERNPQVNNQVLLVPQYRDKDVPLIEERIPAKFEIAGEDYHLLDAYGARVPDNRVMLLAHGGSPQKLGYLRKCMDESETYFQKHSQRHYRNMEVMTGRVIDYFGLRQRELEQLRNMNDDDIVHFKQMTVEKSHADEIQRRVDNVIKSQTSAGKARVAEITQKVVQLELDLSDANSLMEEEGLTGRQTYQDDLALEYIANHYYLPVLFSKGRKLEYIRHIIDTESEVRFLRMVRDYAKVPDSLFRQLDWWYFSKLDQYLDSPHIPYYDPKQNRMARFLPDFVFWAQKGNRYTLLFADPKGLQNIDWERKVDGFQSYFEQAGKPALFNRGDIEITVKLVLFTNDRALVPDGSYKRYWQDNVTQMCRDAFGL